MDRFAASVAAALDVPEIGMDDSFRDVPGWCSLQAFGLLVLLENDWRTPLTVADLARMKTVRDLYLATCAAQGGEDSQQGRK